MTQTIKAVIFTYFWQCWYKVSYNNKNQPGLQYNVCPAIRCSLMVIFPKLRELHEKECKYIWCSEFPWHMACAKPGSKRVNLPPLSKCYYNYTNSMTRPFGGCSRSYFWWSCSLSVNWKISLISLERYAFSGQSDTVTDSSFRYMGLLRFSFKLIVIVLRRSS